MKLVKSISYQIITVIMVLVLIGIRKILERNVNIDFNYSYLWAWLYIGPLL